MTTKNATDNASARAAGAKYVTLIPAPHDPESIQIVVQHIDSTGHTVTDEVISSWMSHSLEPVARKAKEIAEQRGLEFWYE